MIFYSTINSHTCSHFFIAFRPFFGPLAEKNHTGIEAKSVETVEMNANCCRC